MLGFNIIRILVVVGICDNDARYFAAVRNDYVDQPPQESRAGSWENCT